MQEGSRLRIQVKRVTPVSEGICREYALLGNRQEKQQEKTDWKREREKMKEMLLPFIKETVKKQLKEEREYYKSRPSMAAKQLESIFGAGRMEAAAAAGITSRVYEELEARIRREWVRKGR